MATGFIQAGNHIHARGGAVPDPFSDLASLAMPTTMPEVFRWCARVFERMGVYSAAIRRIVAYFVTDIEIECDDDGVKQKYMDYLKNELQIVTKLTDYGLDFLFTGNELLSALPPLRWHAYCPQCGNEHPLDKLLNGYDHPEAKWSNLTVHALCRGKFRGKSCGYYGPWNLQERRAGHDPLVIKRWPPGEIQIFYDKLRERARYIWKIPNEYRNEVKRGELTTLMGLYREVLEAIRTNSDLELSEDAIFHLKEHRLAEQDNKGWGMPRMLGTFSMAYSHQMLMRYNDGICLDFVVPFRCISPAAGVNIENDPAWRGEMASNMWRIARMIRDRNANPTKWHAMPFKVDYTVLGGDAKQFAPRELLDSSLDMLLNAIGCPVEFYKATLTAQAAGPALRLFEANHAYLFSALNRALQFVCDSVATHKNWESVTAKLTRPSHADDIVMQQTRLQMALNQQLSATTALQGIGANFQTEARRKMDEAAYMAKLEQEMKDKQDKGTAAQQLFPPMDSITMLQQQQAAAQQQGAGGPPQPGAPPQGGALPPMPSGGPGGMGAINSPDDYMAAAGQIADDLLQRDETTRKQYLNQLRQSDPIFSRVVIDELNKRRRQQPQQQQQAA